MDHQDRLVDSLEKLIYCMNAKPRLFRWHDGKIEWRPRWHPRRWRVLIDP